MSAKQFYDREDFYQLDEVERVLGYKLCHDSRHYLNSHDCIYEDECCRHLDDKYLVRVEGKDFILRSYAENLISDKVKYDIEHLRIHRFQAGIELGRRTPRYVVGQPMHPVTKDVDYRQKHRKSHR